MTNSGSLRVSWVLSIIVALGTSGCASGPAAQPTSYVYPQKGQTAQQQANDTSASEPWVEQPSGFARGRPAPRGRGVGGLPGAGAGRVGDAAIAAARGHAGPGGQGDAAGGGSARAGVGGVRNDTKALEGYDRA